jgi:hypothetical protein
MKHGDRGAGPTIFRIGADYRAAVAPKKPRELMEACASFCPPTDTYVVSIAPGHGIRRHCQDIAARQRRLRNGALRQGRRWAKIPIDNPTAVVRY